MSSKQIKIQYENRVVCFLDILGFGECVHRTIAKDQSILVQKVREIAGLLEAVRDNIDLGKYKNEDSAQITQFSDSIVISFIASKKGEVHFTLERILWLLIELIKRGFVCRGGIALGYAIHDNRFLFGPAFIDAYELEKKTAIYPRVIIQQSIISLAGQYPSFHHNGSDEVAYVKELAVKDDDIGQNKACK